jgi:xanthine dehydrogenase accessory factor
MEALSSGAGASRRFDFTREGENATGTTCGGSAEVLIEVHEPDARLLVFGGGHVGQALVRLARGVGFRAVVVDDRAEYADPARFPEGVEALRRDFRNPTDLPTVDGRTFVVVVTRCHETDRRVLEALAEAETPYLAMVGSRRKWAVMRGELEEAGFDPAWLERIHVPAGLDLGGETPGEIALEILAEVVRTRNRPDEPPERPARALRAVKGRKG